MSLLILTTCGGSSGVKHEVQPYLQGFCALCDLAPVYISSFCSQHTVLQTSHNSLVHHMLFLDLCALISFMVLSWHVLLPCSPVRRTLLSLQQKIKPLHDSLLMSFSICFILLLRPLLWSHWVFEVKDKFLIFLFTVVLA